MSIRGAFISVIAISTSAAAQEPPDNAVPPVGTDVHSRAGPNPAVVYLMNQYSLDEGEATKRIELQTAIGELASQIQTSNEPSFAGVDIQHDPVFRIVVSFSEKKDRNEFIQSVEPRLRQYIQIRQVKRSRAAKRADLRKLETALAGGQKPDFRAGEAPFIVNYDTSTQQFEILVETEEQRSKLSPLVPEEFADEATFSVGPLPKPSQSGPVGAQAGDWATAGYTIYYAKSETANRCTIGYSVRYGVNNTPAVITSAHCTLPQFLKYDGRWIELKSPLYKKWDNSHDFQVLDIGVMSTDSWVWAWEAEPIPEFDDQEWFQTVGRNSYYTQTKGTVVCKQGSETGITCGQIRDVDNGYGGSYSQPWIEVSWTYQSDISKGGDSGGPWFVYPGSSQRIRAVGVHTAGGKKADGSSDTGYYSRAIYMPIERVFNNHPVNELIVSP